MNHVNAANIGMRKPVDGLAALLMIVLSVIWGMQQVAIKSIAADVSPSLQVALRSGAGAILVWLYSRHVARDRWLPGLATRAGTLVGVLFALEFLFVSVGLQWTSAAHMAVFLYTAPMFAAMGLHLTIPAERLDRLQWGGIVLALAGILITFLAPREHGSNSPIGPHWLAGDLMGLLGGLAWGLTTVAVRNSRLSEAPAAQTLFYQLLVAFLILLPFAAMRGQLSFRGTTLVWVSLGFQGLIVAFGSYLTWFWLLRRYLAARLGVLSLMTPLFGVAFGAWLLRESIDTPFLIGGLLVIAGMVVVNGHEWPKQFRARRA